MLTAGLVSVTFRDRTPREICTLCSRAGLSAVEWGADIHVPPENVSHARSVRRLCEDHGLIIPSYGSYYRVMQPLSELRRCLDTACALNTDTVRIWCGTKGSRDAEEERKYIIEALIKCAQEARSRRITLALEYHTRTLTDERKSVQRLLEETASVSDCLSLCWQPHFDWTQEECVLSLEDVLPRLAHIHAFTWRGNDGKCRLPLEDGKELWKNALSLVRARDAHTRKDRCVLLEFVQNDSTDALMRDAAVLRRWLSEASL